ncbi:MAG: hypothetical protein A3G34_11500 [Candidatus Lindowbacteria bacterium RIFCSPLOWO2_12_FULL_62_27]|nr:MAG: hypothetical protein A3I06_14475 [Candidatus Lindowbacteria bacterium RIFCSPLOWO2_02_FULL_62_12]OGH60881.1 MAG: hypothetical protein A3G34_11500 [Candidatus Lindowbacteria bacterium RIFCSPLOWO2_12_FULL_62_27]
MAFEFQEISPTAGVLRTGVDVRPENIEGYRKKLYELCERKNFTLYLDMAGAEHLSSWAIGVTALAAQKIRQNGGNLKMYGAGDNLKRILKYSRLDMIIEASSDPPPAQ